RGISVAQAEAELIWEPILQHALSGELDTVYGTSQRWQEELESPVLLPPAREDLRRYVIPMLGVYPARGCPYNCNFCSVVKIAGKKVRGEPVARTIESLLRAKAAGVRLVMFTSDTFNKYPNARALLRAMIEARISIPSLHN